LHALKHRLKFDLFSKTTLGRLLLKWKQA